MRTSVVLAVIAAALLGYIFVYERGTISTGELEQRKGSALPEFVRDRVSKLEIQRKGVTTVLERDPEADLVSDAAQWRVTAPFRAAADPDAVDTLIGELEWIDGRRRIENVSDEDRKRFGLLAPRYRVWFTVGKTRVPLVVGGESPRGDGVYVATGDRAVVHVVGKNFVEALDHEPGHYHTRELHDGILLSTVTRFTLSDAQGERAIRKRDDGLWDFERGAAGLAAAPAVEGLIDAADDLRAKRFVAKDAEDLNAYGLASPRFELALHIRQFSETKRDEKGKPVREDVTWRLRAGGACKDHAGESYVTVEGSGTVHCVADEDLAKLQKSAADLRDARLLPLADDAIAGVELERDGAKLVLSRADDAWSFEVTRGGKTAAKGKAREAAVLDWFKALRAVTATGFDAQHPAKPAVTLRILRTKQPAFELRGEPAGSAELVVQRGDEPKALAFPASALDLLQPEAARFRELRLIEHAPEALRQLEVRRDGQLERLSRDGAGFDVKEPIQADADGVAASEVARLLSSLEAVRFVADAPLPAHGLSAPAVSAVAEYEKPAKAGDAKSTAPRRVVLRIGAPTDGGRFATLEGDSAVFVLSSQLADLLAAPLVTRTLLATPLERIRTLELAQGKRQLRIERREGAFVASDGAVPEAVAGAAARALATLRAARVIGYGPASAEQGLDRPFARVTVVAGGEAGGEQRYSIALGAETEGGRYARRDDRPVTFVLPEAAVKKLLAFDADSIATN